MKIESVYISKNAPVNRTVIWGKPTDKGILLLFNTNGEWRPCIGESSNNDSSDGSSGDGDTYIYLTEEQATKLYLSKSDAEQYVKKSDPDDYVEGETLVIVTNE